jgi:O-antigen/teichoic acid export membrane protein
MKSRAGTAKSLFATQILVAIFGLPVTIILARNLGPSDYGNFQFLFRVSTILVSLLCVGLPHAVAWYVSRDLSIGEKRAVVSLFSLASGFGGAAFAASMIVFGLFFDKIDYKLWLLMSVFGVFNLFTANLVNYFRGLLDISGIRLVKYTQVISWTAMVGSAIAFGGLDLQWVVISAVAAQVLSALAGVSSLLRTKTLFGKSTEIPKRQIFKFSISTYPGLAMRDLNIYAGQIAIGLVLSSKELGIYSAALALVSTLGFISGPLTNTIQPFVQRASIGKVTSTVIDSLSSSFILMSVPAVLLALSSYALVPLLFGAKFSSASPIVAVLCIAMFLEGLSLSMYGALLGLGKPGKTSISASITTATNLSLVALLLVPFGLFGVALAAVLSNLVSVVVLMRAISKCLNLRISRICVDVLARAPHVIPIILKSFRKNLTK